MAQVESLRALTSTLRSSAGPRLRWMRDSPLVPLVILSGFVVAALFAPWISPHDPLKTSLQDRNDEPIWMAESSGKFILGADFLGRDVLSRVIHGARVSLIIGTVAMSTGIVVGTTLGLVAGYFGGNVDEIITRLADINAAIPFLLLALIAVMVFGQSFFLIIMILAYGTWSGFARQVRGLTLSLKTMEYVALAKVAGASSGRILYRHILPGVVNTVVVIATLGVGSVILSEAILSFLGAGIPPPTPAWGAMVADGRDYLASAWWVAFFPGMAILFTVLALNFTGDWLRDRLDPRLRQI